MSRNLSQHQRTLDKPVSYCNTWQILVLVCFLATEIGTEVSARDWEGQVPAWTWNGKGPPGPAAAVPHESATFPMCVWAFSFLTCPPLGLTTCLRFMCQRQAHPGNLQQNLKQIPRIWKGGTAATPSQGVSSSWAQIPLLPVDSEAGAQIPFLKKLTEVPA